MKQQGGTLNPTAIARDGNVERLVGVTSQGRVVCLDTATGKQVWSVDAGPGNIRPNRVVIRDSAVYLLQMRSKPTGQICWQAQCLSLTDGSQTWISAEMLDFDVRDWSVGREAIALAGNKRNVVVQNGRVRRQTYGGALMICLDVRSGRVVQSEEIQNVSTRANMFVQVNLRGVGSKLWAAFPTELIAFEKKETVRRVPDLER
jgi:outer membrane protein assembly factor BamB